MLKDPLGLDGDLAMKDEAKRHEKKKLEKKRPFVMIKVACRHYNTGMNKKCKYLHDDINKSKNGTYDKMDYSWMREYDEEMMDVSNNA
jgi:aspartyl aminopeptidase